MKKTINVKFNYEDKVVLKTQPEVVRIISGYLIRPKNITYGLACGEEETWHQEIEIETANSKVFKVKGFQK